MNDGALHQVNYTISDSLRVDNGPGGAATEVEIVAGAKIYRSLPMGAYDVGVLGDSVVRMYGGTIGAMIYSDVAVMERGGFELYGGKIGRVNCFENSILTVAGGDAGDLTLSGASLAAIQAGSVGSITAKDSSRITLSGGQTTLNGGYIRAMAGLSGDAVLRIEGAGFLVDGVATDPTVLVSTGGIGLGEPMRRLSGTLASGEAFALDVRLLENSQVVLVPLPETGVLMIAGGWLMGRRRISDRWSV